MSNARMILLVALCSSALAVTGVGCASNPSDTPNPRVDPFEARKIPAELQADVGSVVAGNNAFAADLYAQLRSTDGNLFFSPFSVAAALSMTSAGAAGVTADEMARVLHSSLAREQFHPANGALIQSLDRGVALGGYRLNVANRLWGQTGFPFLESFLKTTREDYAAEMALVEFSRAPEAARTTINDWVSEKTETKIKDLMPEGSVTSDTRLVLTNAVYFKGKWAGPFDPDLTQDAPFHLDASRTVEVPTMVRLDKWSYARAEGVELLELPYEGGDISMVILLPSTIDGLSDLEARLTSANLDAWLASLETAELELALPRFRVTSSFGLNSTLTAMGMPSAFDPLTADFSGMDGRRDLSIQAVVHKGFVDVNEEGTEAAAATGVGVGVTSLPQTLRIDHPFVIVIRDNVTGSFLFMGRIADPSA